LSQIVFIFTRESETMKGEKASENNRME